MKKFIVRFLVWLSIPMVLAFGVDYMISSGLRKTDLRKYAAWNDIYSGELHPDLVAVGSSRVWLGYNTYILDSLLHCNSYNLGLDGHYIDFQQIRYDTYRRYNAKPNVMLLNVDCLSTFGITADSRYEREQFFPYLFDDTLILKVASAKKITWIDRHLPLVRYFGYRDEFEWGIEAFFGRRHFDDGGMHKGYRGDNAGWDAGPILHSDSLVAIAVDARAVDLLDAFVAKSMVEGTKVVFVKSPVYEPLLSKISNVADSDSVFEKIALKYQIPILDYYHSKVSQDSTNFMTPGHLNKKGSEAFTVQLCHDLDSMQVFRSLNEE